MAPAGACICAVGYGLIAADSINCYTVLSLPQVQRQGRFTRLTSRSEVLADDRDLDPAREPRYADTSPRHVHLAATHTTNGLSRHCTRYHDGQQSRTSQVARNVRCLPSAAQLVTCRPALVETCICGAPLRPHRTASGNIARLSRARLTRR